MPAPKMSPPSFYLPGKKGEPKPVPGAIAYYRFDEGRNLLKYSQDFDNAAWDKTNIRISSDVALAPNRTMSADIISDGSSGSAVNHYMTQIYSGVNPTQTVTASVFAKPGTIGSMYLRINPGDGTYYGIQVDLSTGAVTSPTGTITYTTPQLINGFYRISVSMQVVGTYVRMGIYPSVAGNTIFVEDGTHNFYIWGAQLEVGSTPSEYFPTTDKQLIIDYSGNGNHGYLGSQPTGVDTNDPAWNEKGLVFGGDDGVKLSKLLPPIYTFECVFYNPTPITAQTPPQYLFGVSAGVMFSGVVFGAATTSLAYELITIVPDSTQRVSWCSQYGSIPAGWHHLVCTLVNSVWRLSLDGISLPVSLVNTPGPITPSANDAVIGSKVDLSGGIVGQIAGLDIYPFGISQSQENQNRDYWKSYLNPKGVILP